MSFPDRALALLREPLVHFLLIGAMVYAVLSGRPPDAGERQIVVDEAVVGRLLDRWQQSFRRLPSKSELDAQIREYVKDEVYYREALRLGLDDGDEAVRRLMRNKLVATVTSEAETSQPSDAELQALLDKDPARYASEARYDFYHYYKGQDTPQNRARCAEMAVQLERGLVVDFDSPLPIPRSFNDTPTSEIAAVFGADFAAKLQELPVDRWNGPVLSGFGLHIIRIKRRTSQSKPKLADVRQRLENDWRATAIAAAEDKRYRELLAGYDVVTKLD